MENDFCAYTIKKFIFFIKYVESILYSLETQCLSLHQRIICLLNRVQCSQQIVSSLDCAKEFKTIENWSLIDYMKFDDNFNLKNSYFNNFLNCETLVVLVKENFPSFLKDIELKSVLNYQVTEKPVEMEESRIYNFNEYLRAQRKVNKEEMKKKPKKSHCSKNSKMNNFRNSIGKLFRIKSQSEKSLKHEDLAIGAIPSTIYLSPNASLPRDSRSINKPQFDLKVKPISNPVRHSCSDFTCRRSNTFCIYETGNEVNKSIQNLKASQRLTSPPNSTFYANNIEDVHKMHSPLTSVPHSKSVPMQLSQSQQNINNCKKSTLDSQCSAKRHARKKGIFNCSLFRKRSNSRSKSTDKIHQQKSMIEKSFDKSKNHPQLNDEPSNLSDRCLTLPNLKSSEVDLTSHVNNAQLLSIDLIKDYLNRSDNTLAASVQRNSVDNSSYYQYNSQNHSSASVQNSPLSLPNRKSINELKNYENSKFSMYESLIMENSTQNQSYDKPTITSAYTDVYSGKNISLCDSTSLNSSALDSIYNNSVDLNKILSKNTGCHFNRQISAPHYTSRQIKSKLPQLVQPATGAVEFWTRPYQEKIKASRRRLLDDKVGSKEALLRSMSPQNIRFYEGDNIYDTAYHLQMIPEPPNAIYVEESNNVSNWNSTDAMIRSNPFYSSISPEYHQSGHNILVENRLKESPKPNLKHQETIGKVLPTKYVDSDDIYSTARFNNSNIINNEEIQKRNTEEFKMVNTINQVQQESHETQKMKLLYGSNETGYDDSSSKFKELKSTRSSTELIPTRTPTPPHSFAESSLSSVPPAPKEFLNDSNLSGIKSSRPYGNINLLYSSDNSSVSHEDFAEIDQDFFVPIPPPRTDSVNRSTQFQPNNDQDKSELEYDMTDDFLPILSGASIDKCDIEQYHKWLEKLPYKLSEFPDILHSRKSAVTSKKFTPSQEHIDDTVPEQINLHELKHLKLYRKSIKSWNMSDTSKSNFQPTDEMENQVDSINESSSMKKSFSCDHSLHSSDKTSSIEDLECQVKLSQSLVTTDTTLLRQYSHLYSLKFSPSHNDVLNSIQSASILKTCRSKSIDLRNFHTTNKSMSLVNSNKCSENRKSAPNTKVHLEK